MIRPSILDLEDSVPDQEKAAARPLVKAGIKALAKKGQAGSVRVNGFATGLTVDDIEGVLYPELESVTLPKVETPADMHELDALLTHLERRHVVEGGDRDVVPARTSRTSTGSSATRRGTASSATAARPSCIPPTCRSSNAVFTPSADEIAFNQGLIEAMEDAQRRGIAAVTYKGGMVDEAMLQTSRELLDFARSIGLKV